MAPHHHILRRNDIALADYFHSIPHIMWAITKLLIFIIALIAAFGLVYLLAMLLFCGTSAGLRRLYTKISEWRERRKERRGAGGDKLRSFRGAVNLTEDDEGGE